MLSTAPQPAGTILHVETDTIGRAVVLRAIGEVDILTAPRLRTAIEQTWKPGARVTATLVDLTGVSFLASAGLAVLAGCARSTPAGMRMLVVANSASTLRPLELVGLPALVDVYLTVEDALAVL